LSGHKYTGINLFMLTHAPFEQPLYMTFKQAKEQGGNVKKGSKGLPIVFFSNFKKEDKDTGEEKEFGFLKHSTVFNVSQIEGIEIEEKATAPKFVEHSEPSRVIDKLEAWADAPELEHAGNRATYSDLLHRVTLPALGYFESVAAYDQTLAHEMIHSTGPKLKREMSHEFGSKTYAKEELIAEIGASLLMNECQQTMQIENTAAYLQNWLKALQDDSSLILKAIPAARKAVEEICQGGTK